MSKIEKISDQRVLTFAVSGEQPIERHGGPPYDPQKVQLTINDGELGWPYVSGPAYLANRKLGKREIGGFYGDKSKAPGWLVKLVADEGFEWPT